MGGTSSRKNTSESDEHHDDESRNDVETNRAWSRLHGLDGLNGSGGLGERNQIEVFEIGDLEGADVLDVAISNLGMGVGLVLFENTLRVPVLQLASDGHNTTSAVLQYKLVHFDKDSCVVLESKLTLPWLQWIRTG